MNIKKSQKFLYFFFALFATSFFSWCQTDSLLVGSFPKRFAIIGKTYRESLLSSPDSARKVYARLNDFYAKHGTPRDRLIFEITMLEVERSTNFFKLFFYERVSAVLKETETHGFQDLTAKVHQIISLYHFYTTHNYHLGFKYGLYAFEAIKNLKEDTFPDRDYSIYLFSKTYYDFLDYENAIRIASSLSPKTVSSATNIHVYNSCLLGLSYLKSGDSQSAIRHFNMALAYLPVKYFNNDAWQGILKGSIGLALVQQKNEAEAISFLEEGINLTIKYEVWDNIAVFGSQLSTIYLKRKQWAEAYLYADLAHKAALKIQDPKFKLESYQALADYYRNTGNSHSALVYLDSAIAAKEQWKKEIDVTFKYKAEQAVENERYAAKEQIILKEKEQNTIIRNGLILFLFLCIVITILLYNRRLLKQKYHQEQLVKEKELAEKELENAIIQLNQFRQNIQEKSELINQFSSEIDKLAQEDNNKIQLLTELQRSVILTESHWQEFAKLFERVHKDFFFRLKDKLPQLSPAETRFIALSKLKYSNKEMAAMLGISTDAVRQVRSRFRKKLNIPETTSIEDLADSI